MEWQIVDAQPRERSFADQGAGSKMGKPRWKTQAARRCQLRQSRIKPRAARSQLRAGSGER